MRNLSVIIFMHYHLIERDVQSDSMKTYTDVSFGRNSTDKTAILLWTKVYC